MRRLGGWAAPWEGEEEEAGLLWAVGSTEAPVVEDSGVGRPSSPVTRPESQKQVENQVPSISLCTAMATARGPGPARNLPSALAGRTSLV